MKLIVTCRRFDPLCERDKGIDIVVRMISPTKANIYPLTKEARLKLMDIDWNGELYPIVVFSLSGPKNGTLRFLRRKVPNIKTVHGGTTKVSEDFQWPVICFSCRPNCRSCFR